MMTSFERKTALARALDAALELKALLDAQPAGKLLMPGGQGDARDSGAYKAAVSTLEDLVIQGLGAEASEGCAKQDFGDASRAVILRGRAIRSPLGASRFSLVSMFRFYRRQGASALGAARKAMHTYRTGF